ncbi:cytochrome c [Gammaproteobacteria bacterium]|nr:cytochrome c [Gammaproteobacteria bacterium]
MRKRILLTTSATIFFLFLVGLNSKPIVSSAYALPTSEESKEQGRYLVSAGGCVSCHGKASGTNDEVDVSSLAGGLKLVTDFGDFYAPNITPDKETGIGSWTSTEFIGALKHGVQPDGGKYYPTFPYRAYAGLSDEDVLNIGAYLMSLPPEKNVVPPHELPIWLTRFSANIWNQLANITQRPEAPPQNNGKDTYARGAYLARNLGHCGECHTPRNALGIPKLGEEFAGATLGDEVIEPIDAAALTEWSETDFDLFLLLGMKPDAEFVGGDMSDVIEHNTSRLTDSDRAALASFFITYQRDRVDSEKISRL